MHFTILSAAWLAAMLLMIAASTFMSADQETPVFLWIIYLMGQNSIDKAELSTEISSLRCEIFKIRKENSRQ